MAMKSMLLAVLGLVLLSPCFGREINTVAKPKVTRPTQIEVSQGFANALNESDVEVFGLECVNPRVFGFYSLVCFFHARNFGPAAMQKIAWHWDLTIEFYDYPSNASGTVHQKTFTMQQTLAMDYPLPADPKTYMLSPPASIIGTTNLSGLAVVTFNVTLLATVPTLHRPQSTQTFRQVINILPPLAQ